MKKVIFFDLDSTLLQMNQDSFLEGYFKLIYQKIASLGLDAKDFMNHFDNAVYMIFKNDGSKTNEEAFWDCMKVKYPNISEMILVFEEFYKNEFQILKSVVNINNTSRLIIDCLKEKGYRLVLATNPLFPIVCTEQRMKWAGLDYSDFELVTTYENSSYCKPNIKYYQEIVDKLGISINDFIMVGNDLHDDFVQLDNNVEKYLITDYLINTKNLEITMKSFTLNEFYEYIKENF